MGKFSLLFLFFFLFNSLQAQDKYPRNNSIDILHYKFELEISDNHDSLFGKATISLKIIEPISELTLDLHAVNNLGKGMLVTAIKSNGKDIKYNHEGEKLNISFKRDTGEGQLVVWYQGVPKDGLIISKNKFGDRTFFCDNWPNRASNYLPVIDHPYEKATSQFLVTAPNHYQVISNGVLTESIDIDKNIRQTSYYSYQPLPTKVMVFGAAKFAVQRCDSLGTIPVTSWVYPQEKKNGFYDYAMAVDILEWFENKIAPYPYNQLANVQSKTRYGGMENAGCIFYHENSIDGKRGSEDLFAHEIAHQWFGNSASEADWHHVWLSEGFATYLTEVYKQETQSDSAFRLGMEKAGKKVLLYTKKFPNSKIIDTSITNLNRLLNPCTYQKAAWFLHSLRNYIGDVAFWKGVRAYYNNYKYSNSLSEGFMEEMEFASGRKLYPFFTTWLYQEGLPKFNFTWSQKKGIFLEQVGENFFPVNVKFEIRYKNNKTELVNLNMDSRTIDLSLDFKKDKIESIIFDPYKDILKGK